MNTFLFDHIEILTYTQQKKNFSVENLSIDNQHLKYKKNVKHWNKVDTAKREIMRVSHTDEKHQSTIFVEETNICLRCSGLTRFNIST